MGRGDFLPSSLFKAGCPSDRADLPQSKALISDPVAIVLLFEPRLQSSAHSLKATLRTISPGPYAIYLSLPGFVLQAEKLLGGEIAT